MRAHPGSPIRNLVVAGVLAASASPVHANTSTAFPAGSLIIPSGSAFQDDCGAVSAYGLIYTVLRANSWLAANNYTPITIFYSYLDTKVSPNRCVPTSVDTAPTASAAWNDGCDILNVGVTQIVNNNHAAADINVVTYNNSGKSNVYPKYPSKTITGVVKANYLGGPFVILASDVPVFTQLLDNTIAALDIYGNAIDFAPYRTRNASQPAAPTSTCTLGTDHYVNVHRTTQAFVANIGKAFQDVPPRLALLGTDQNTHTGTIFDGILQKYLKNAALDYPGSNGCPPLSVNVGKKSGGTLICPNGAKSGQIFDEFDFDDFGNDQLTATSGGKPLYSMLWTPHWETTTKVQWTCAGTNCACTTNCYSLKSTALPCPTAKGGGTCDVVAGTDVYFPPSAAESTALGKISTFLDGQKGLSAECASVATYEGDALDGDNNEGGLLQLQTCVTNGAGGCAASTTNYGINRNANPPDLSNSPQSNLRNCSDPNMSNGNKCTYFSYPGDSFSQTGDFLWDASNGHTASYIPFTKAMGAAQDSVYRPGVVPLIAYVNSLDTTKVGSPVPYNGTLSASATAARAMIMADLTTRNIKDNTPGKANVLYLAAHDQTGSVAGSKVMLETLLQLGLTNLPPISSIVEVSRNSPIAATIDGNPMIVQGTYEFLTPPGTVTTFSTDADVNVFRFPYLKGHLRGRNTGAIGTTASLFNGSGVAFDASGAIPDPVYANTGCTTKFTSTCRSVFTTTVGGQNPPLHFLDHAEAATLGPLMGANLTAANQEILIQRIIAGRDDILPNQFHPALGGIDRSTVAVIEASPLVNSTRPTMAYFGAADGMIHAVCATNAVAPCDIEGRELWAYLPRVSLSTVRYNTARIDGSPHVIDAYGDFTQSGKKTWHTILMFQTGTGDTTGMDRVPAVYCLDVSNPVSPTVLWEYSLADTAARGSFELGVGMTLAAGRVQTGTNNKFIVFAQTNNAGTLGSGDVVTAINTETGQKEWQAGYQFTTALRAGGASIPPATGVPGGAVAIDKMGQGYVTDVYWGTLYGDLWEVDPVTGVSRYGAGKPLFRFSTDFHGIGTKPAIYSKGGIQYAVVATGGYAEQFPNDTTWTTAGNTNYALSISLNTPVVDAIINENKGAPDIGFKFALGAGESGYAQATVIGNQVFITTDTADTNDNTAPGAYGTTGASGHVYRYDFSSNTQGATVVVEGGISSVINSGNGVYSGASDQQVRLGTDATCGTVGCGTQVDPALAFKVTRKLWLRTQ